MIFLLPAFENLLQAYLPLIHMIEESGMGIHISEGRLNLTPPQNARCSGNPQGFRKGQTPKLKGPIQTFVSGI